MFRITLGSGRVVKLHIEFQGPSSHEPMRLRMLDYMARLVNADPDLDLSSVVFYVGQGAGATDKGEHVINGPDDKPALQWRYHVIHLWKMKAEELLVLHQPVVLPLIGQTQIDQPKVILPQVVEELNTVSDEGLRKRLFAGLLALMNDEEASQMIEALVEKEELLTDTPFLRRIRKEAHTEGWNEGLRSSSLRNILDVLKWRFDPTISRYEQIQQALDKITATEQLEAVLKLAVQAADLETFQKGLQAQLNQQASQQTNGEK
ncbi:MAG: hypothetical protein U0350_38485 [Caldilineaceae bacterium]